MQMYNAVRIQMKQLYSKVQICTDAKNSEYCTIKIQLLQ